MQLSGSEYTNDTILMKSGGIFFTITVNDTAGHTITSSLTAGTVVNKPPEVSNLEFIPATVTSSDSLTLNYSFFDIDDDLESGTEIRWYNNSILLPSFNDLLILPSSALVKGDQWFASVRPRDGNLYGFMVNSTPIIIQNTIPTVSNVGLTPNNPVNTSAITLSYNYFDLDGDSENTGNREIRWYKNGILESSYNNLPILPNTATSKDESWNAQIRVNDGSEYSNWINSTSVTIRNSAPTASNVIILNSFPFTTDDLVANWTFIDVDLDPENSNWILLWYNNDILQNNLNDTKTVLYGNTTKTDIWYFKLTVFDGTNYSIVYQSPSVQILNSPPTVLDMDITLNPTTTDTLTSSWIFADDDGDSESAIKNITWYKDGIYQPTFDNLTTIDSGETTKGEVWHYLLQVYDGETFSNVYNSSNYSASVMILNSVPTASNVEISNQNPYTSDDLIANWDEQDDDGLSDIDPVYKNITWYKNGVYESSYYNLTTLPSSATAKGEIWNFILQIYDGDNFSVFYNSSSVIIQNSLPTATDRKFNTSSVTTNDDFSISYNFTDIDGDLEDTEKLIVYWFVNLNYNALYDNLTTIFSSNTTDGEYYYYIMRVFDGTSYSSNLTSEGIGIGGTPPNTAPSASDLSEPITASTTDDLIGNYTYSDGENHPEGESEIRWYKNGVLQPSYNNTNTIPFSVTQKGDNWHFTIVPKDIFGLNGPLQTSGNITIANTAPSASDFSLTQNPYTTTNILVSWIFSDVDGDSENSTINLTWYKDGVIVSSYNNKTQVNSSDTSKNQVWYFLLQVFDGEEFSTTYNSSQLGIFTTVINSTPEATNLRFENPSPLTNDNLIANWTFSDIDNDLESPGWEIYWYKSNVLQVNLNGSQTVSSGNTAKNQIWYFELRVYDGENYSILYQSPNIQILNSAPTITNISITSGPRTTDELVASWLFLDVDGDTPSIILNITWYKDGVHQSSHGNSTSVPSSATSKGEIWHYLLQVHDGSVFSDTYNSSDSGASVLILNTIPSVSIYSITNQEPKTNDDLIASWVFVDVDGDSESVVFNLTWYKNNQYMASFDNLTTLPSTATLKGELWHFVIQVYDGEDFSLSYSSSQVMILNTAPILIGCLL
ncbi:MAG: hypothetical protein ACW99Q_15720 [Candidatus Kariarchaeaceae archaeon]|jgi:hypothetical protein